MTSDSTTLTAWAAMVAAAAPAAPRWNPATDVYKRQDVSLESAVHGVIAEHVCHVVRSHAGIIDTHKFNIFTVDTCSKDESTNSAEAIDPYFDRHKYSSKCLKIAVETAEKILIPYFCTEFNYST